MYFYSNHLSGGIYYNEEELDFDELYCEQCGDSDWFHGDFESFSEAWEYFKDDCDLDGAGGWELKYIFTKLCEAFDIPSKLDMDSSTQEEILREIENITDRGSGL